MSAKPVAVGLSRHRTGVFCGLVWRKVASSKGRGMSKIPVFATVSRAYGFLLGDIPTIARLTWAPLLIGAGLSYLYGPQMMDAAIAAKDNPDALAALAPTQFLIGVAAFVTGIMASVALLRVVLFGDRKPGLVVYLWFGGAELRLVIVTILLAVAVIAAMIGAALVIGLLGVMSSAVPGMGLLVSIAVFGILIGSVYAALRLTLISPVVVAENNLGVERSWQLMAGNVLRMLLVLILTFVPYFVVAALAGYVAIGADFPPLPAFPALAGADAEATKAAAEAFGKAMEAWQIDLTKAMRAHYVELTVLGFFGNMISTALGAGAFGSAYNAITDHQAGA